MGPIREVKSPKEESNLGYMLRIWKKMTDKRDRRQYVAKRAFGISSDIL